MNPIYLVRPPDSCFHFLVICTTFEITEMNHYPTDWQHFVFWKWYKKAAGRLHFKSNSDWIIAKAYKANSKNTYRTPNIAFYRFLSIVRFNLRQRQGTCRPFSSMAIFSNENAMLYRVTSSISYINTQHIKTAHSVMQELEVINKIRQLNKCMNVFSLLVIRKAFAEMGDRVGMLYLAHKFLGEKKDGKKC